MFLKPANSALKVPMPNVRGRYLPPEGAEVGDKDFYWLRRIAAGDVVRATPSSGAAPSPAEGPTPAPTSTPRLQPPVPAEHGPHPGGAATEEPAA